MHIYFSLMKIIELNPSNRKNKRYQVIFDTGQKINFGDINGFTYIDHHDKKKRDNYIKRHLGNKTEYHRIVNLIPSAALASFYILWGPYTDIKKNIKYLNRLLHKK